MVLSPEGNSIQLESNMISLAFTPSSEGAVEPESDFILPNDMDISFVPMPFRCTALLNEDAISYRISVPMRPGKK
jgi:hypothetical protein